MLFVITVSCTGRLSLSAATCLAAPGQTARDAAPKSLLNVWRPAMLRRFALCALALFFTFAAHAETPQALSIPPDSPRWDLEGQAKLAEYQGRKCLLIDGG